MGHKKSIGKYLLPVRRNKTKGKTKQNKTDRSRTNHIGCWRVGTLVTPTNNWLKSFPHKHSQMEWKKEPTKLTASVGRNHFIYAVCFMRQWPFIFRMFISVLLWIKNHSQSDVHNHQMDLNRILFPLCYTIFDVFFCYLFFLRSPMFASERVFKTARGSF